MKTSDRIMWVVVVSACMAVILLIIAVMMMYAGYKEPGDLLIAPLGAGIAAVVFWFPAMAFRALERIADGIENLASEEQKNADRIVAEIKPFAQEARQRAKQAREAEIIRAQQADQDD